MSDIMMCNNKDCSLNDSCFRYITEPAAENQSIMMYPDMDCVDKGYFMHWDKGE